VRLPAADNGNFEAVRIEWGDSSAWLTRCSVHGISAVDVEFTPTVCGPCLFWQYEIRSLSSFSENKQANYAASAIKRRKPKRKKS